MKSGPVADVRRDAPQPLYQQLVERLKKMMAEMAEKGEKMLPSEREMCRLFSVSHTTVRLALKELEVAGLLLRVPGKGTFLGEPADAAGTETLAYGVILEKFAEGQQTDFRVNLLGGMRQAARKAGVSLMLLGEEDEIFMLETVSAPLAPYVVWQMDPVKFPINSNEIFFLSMVLGIIAYCSVSFLTMKEPFNLERMLHRGIYRDPNEKVAVPKKPSVWGSLVKLIGIDENYTRGDKIIAWSVFFFSFVYSFLLCFVGILLWNWLSPWPIQYWSYYFLIVNLVIPCIIAAISMVWFSIGGLIDLRRMFRDLKARIDNPLDDGRVNGHVSLVDTAVFTEDEKQANKRRK